MSINHAITPTTTTGPATRTSAQSPLGCQPSPHMGRHCPPPPHLACPPLPHSPHMIGSLHQLCHPRRPPTQGAITLPLLIVLIMINHQHCKPPGKFIVTCTFFVFVFLLSFYFKSKANLSDDTSWLQPLASTGFSTMCMTSEKKKCGNVLNSV